MINYKPIVDTLQWFDRTLLQVRQNEARQGRPVCLTCAKGCSACCSEQVICTTAEAGLIVAALSHTEREALKVKVTDWLQRAAAAGVNPLCELDTHQFTAIEYRRLRLACPLLQDGLCSVYAHRPLNCRMFMTGGPRQSCEDLEKRPRQKFLTIKELWEAAFNNLHVALDKAGFLNIGVSHLGYLLAIELGLLQEDQV